ncbi:MAG: site-specific integrase [Dehalococcoidia bacterium]|nr:site-specific integrase [Dehalococcoidia bacterium]
MGLRWEDLDLDARTLRVNRTIQRVEVVLIAVPPKTAKSRRTIPLPSFAVLALRGHRTRQLQERLHAGEAWSDAGLVFTGERGQPLDGPHTTRRFQRILASVCRVFGGSESGHAGAADHDFRALPRMRFHDLRHGAASLMLAQGVPLSTISDILGHSGIRITADTYAHLTDELKRDAANATDAAFGKTAEQGR